MKEKGEHEQLPEDHWFTITKKLYKETGAIPGKLEIVERAIINALEIPAGQVSALGTTKEGKRESPQKDKIIAEMLTNKAGVIINKEKGIISTDFRDIHPGGLPEQLKQALNPRTLAIMELEYEHEKYIREKFGNTENQYMTDTPIHYFRLPGGVDLFLRGYIHNEIWHRNHKDFLQKINIDAQVIAIEGNIDRPYGASLELYWGDPDEQLGDYDALMHEAVKAGFNGLFTEVDARDESKVMMDNMIKVFNFEFPNLPEQFYKTFFEFFEKQHPKLAEKINSPEKLKQILIAHSITKEGLLELNRAERERTFHKTRAYNNPTYLSESGDMSLEPTFMELGQFLFSDALSAVKLHLIAKLMADGHIPKGPIIDYEGAKHLSSKSFFLRYPEYAVEVVLRSINELMAGRVKREGNIREIYKVFKNPDWREALKEITRLVFKKAEGEKLIDVPVDFLSLYNINPEEVLRGK